MRIPRLKNQPHIKSNPDPVTCRPTMTAFNSFHICVCATFIHPSAASAPIA